MMESHYSNCKRDGPSLESTACDDGNEKGPSHCHKLIEIAIFYDFW
jgi:hypothetical protein